MGFNIYDNNFDSVGVKLHYEKNIPDYGWVCT